MTRENTFHQNYSGKTTEFVGKPLLFVYMTGLICKDGGGFDSQNRKFSETNPEGKNVCFLACFSCVCLCKCVNLRECVCVFVCTQCGKG